MAQRFFHDDQIRVLKETVRFVFWTKRELRALFIRCDVADRVLAKANFDDVTWNIVDTVLDALNLSEGGIAPLRKIADETLRYKDGSHLGWAGKDRVDAATQSLARLRAVIGEHSEEVARQHSLKESRSKSQSAVQKSQFFHSKIESLRSDFLGFYGASDHRARGIALEKLLNELFDLFDLASKGSFARKGEQIDGALRLDQRNCLLEAKWQREKVILADLRDLDAAVGTTLETTLGIFISIEGFSQDALEAYLQGNRPKLICMDGGDLMLVLEGRIRLDDLLRRKLDIASERRKIAVSADDILKGKY